MITLNNMTITDQKIMDYSSWQQIFNNMLQLVKSKDDFSATLNSGTTYTINGGQVVSGGLWLDLTMSEQVTFSNGITAYLKVIMNTNSSVPSITMNTSSTIPSNVITNLNDYPVADWGVTSIQNTIYIPLWKMESGKLKDLRNSDLAETIYSEWVKGINPVNDSEATQQEINYSLFNLIQEISGVDFSNYYTKGQVDDVFLKKVGDTAENLAINQFVLFNDTDTTTRPLRFTSNRGVYTPIHIQGHDGSTHFQMNLDTNSLYNYDTLRTYDADVNTFKGFRWNGSGDFHLMVNGTWKQVAYEEDLLSVEIDYTTLETNVNNNTSNISTLQNDVAENTTDITTLQNNVATNTNNIALQSNEIDSLQTDLDNLTDLVDLRSGDSEAHTLYNDSNGTIVGNSISIPNMHLYKKFIVTASPTGSWDARYQIFNVENYGGNSFTRQLFGIPANNRNDTADDIWYSSALTLEKSTNSLKIIHLYVYQFYTDGVGAVPQILQKGNYKITSIIGLR